MTPIKLYRNPKSGHCHRVELMLALLDLPYETIDLDMATDIRSAAVSDHIDDALVITITRLLSEPGEFIADQWCAIAVFIEKVQPVSRSNIRVGGAGSVVHRCLEAKVNHFYFPARMSGPGDHAVVKFGTGQEPAAE